jgi:DnaJ-class molecular chaperone
MKDCPDCDGDGYFNDSECCNAPIKWGDICTACGEHAGFCPCYNCEGTGKIPLIDDELQELKDAEAERIYENNKSENEIK